MGRAVSHLGPVLKGEAKDALIFTGAGLLNRLGGLLLLPLYWTRLLPEDYGVLAVIAIIAAFQTLLSALSLDLAVTRFYYEWPDSVRRRNLGAIWIWNWIATIVGGGLFLLVFPVLAPILFPDVSYEPWLRLGIMGTTLANLFIIPASSLRIKRRPWLFAVYNLGGFAVSTALGLWFVLFLNQGLLGLITSMIWSNLLLAVAGALVMFRWSQPCLSSPGLREGLRFSLPAIPSLLISTTASILDRLLLSSFTSLATLGLYSVALKFVDVLGALHASLKMTYGPFMMKHISADRARGSDLVVSVIPYYLIPYFAGGLGLSLFIAPLVHLINRPEYFGVVELVPWLVGISLIGSVGFYYTNGLFLGNRTDLLFIPAGVYLGVLAITSVLLIGPYQVAGLLVSRFVSAAALFGLSLFLSQRAFHQSQRWDALVKLATAAVLFAAGGQFLAFAEAGWEILSRALLWVAFLILAWWLVDGSRRVPRASSLASPQP